MSQQLLDECHDGADTHDAHKVNPNDIGDAQTIAPSSVLDGFKHLFKTRC